MFTESIVEVLRGANGAPLRMTTLFIFERLMADPGRHRAGSNPRGRSKLRPYKAGNYLRWRGHLKVAATGLFEGA